MAKFGINDILNAKTKAAGQQAQGYKEIYLSPYEVKAAEENTHQKLEGIEELADSFLHVGQEQPTVLATQERTYIKANGDVWEHTSWWEWNYIIALLKIMAKTEDLQEAYGNGNMSGYVNDSTKYYGVLASGSMDDKGQFYGYNAGNKQIKVFHTEAMWGDQWERICQMVCDKGVVKVQPYGDCNLTGAGFEKVLDFADYGVSGSVGGYMKDTVMTKAGRFPVTYTGSSSTYLCDYFWLNTGIVAVPLVGGHCSYGLVCGACVSLNNAAGDAYWNRAPGLSCKMPNAA